MSLFLPAVDSLRRKTVLAYSAVTLLVVALSAFSLIEMRLLETQVRAGERISQFLGVVLEMRRFEKNYFLYRETADLDEARAYLAQAQQILVADDAVFARFADREQLDLLVASLTDYARLMSADAAHDQSRQAAIREAGKEAATLAEDWSRRERGLLQTQLERHRHGLLVSIGLIVAAMVVIGQMLARGVARPLKALERSMVAVAAGHRSQLDLPTRDREIASLVAAFNHVLEELELRRGQLQRSEKLAALGTLLSGVAHELNNPLSNISTSCEILGEEVGAGGTALQRELIGQIDQETWRARRIVRSLLDYARDRDFRRERVPLRPLVEDSLRLLRGQLPAQVSLRLDIAPQLEAWGDRQRLQQALFNLVGNARDALDGAGEIIVAARYTQAPWPDGALGFGPGRADRLAVEIAVRDTGHGIPAEVLPRIFDPFFTTKEVGHGLGLGLFIVFEIVAEHGGCIAVMSAPDQGTSFLLRLPVPENLP